jgi:hypothetical protein
MAGAGPSARTNRSSTMVRKGGMGGVDANGSSATRAICSSCAIS